MSENIIAAIVAYLKQALAGSLGITTGSTGVWAYYARSTTDGVPYVVVQGGPEQYTDSQAGGSENWDGSGAGELVEVMGDVYVAVVAPTAELARSLSHLVVVLCRDSVVTLACADGEITYMRPIAAAPEPMMDTGPAIPGVFKRTVTIRYKQEFYAPLGVATTGAV